MPIGQLVPGTKENIRVTVRDNAGTVSDLTGSGPTFTVKDSAGANKVTAASATASGLVITVPLDTTVGGVWAEDEYRLFVKYTVGSEVIEKGPFYFVLSYA
jgi:hypothetical protein